MNATNQSNQTTDPVERAAMLTAREEGWCPTSECEYEDYDGIDRNEFREVIQSATSFHEPPFFNWELGEFSSCRDWKALLEERGIPIYPSSWRIPKGISNSAAVVARELRALIASMTDDGLPPLVRADRVFWRPTAPLTPRGALLTVVHLDVALARFFWPDHAYYDGIEAIHSFLDTRRLALIHQTAYNCHIVPK